MRTRLIVIGVLVLAVVPVTGFAQGKEQSTTSRSAGAVMSGLTLQLRQTNSRPFVFHVPLPTALPRTDTSKPTVVCGMVLVPADPTFDASMRRDTPKTADKTTFTIKAIQPTVCTRDSR